MNTKASGSELFREISKLLDSIADQAGMGQLSRIEKDIIREKLRKIYDQVSLDMDIEPPAVESVDFEIEIAKENVISSAVIEEQIQQSETESIEIETEELLSEVAESKKPSASEEELPDLFSPSEISKPESKTLVEAIAAEDPKESVADILQKQSKVESLKKAIGINEKFFFINELFDGNLNEYNKTIDSLDSMESIEECFVFLEELSQKNNWQGNAEAVEQLRQFIERKLK